MTERERETDGLAANGNVAAENKENIRKDRETKKAHVYIKKGSRF